MQTDEGLLKPGLDQNMSEKMAGDLNVHRSQGDRSRRDAKVAKNDDAPIPEHLWDEVIVPDGDPRKIAALSVIRHFALWWWW